MVTVEFSDEVWQEPSFERQTFTSFIVDRERERSGRESRTEREKDGKNQEFIGKREIFSEPLNREITLSGVGHTHTHTTTISRQHTHSLYTVHVHSHNIRTQTHTTWDYTEVRGEGQVHTHTHVLLYAHSLSALFVSDGTIVCLIE